MSDTAADYDRVYRGARMIYATQIGIDTNDDREVEFLIPIVDAALQTMPEDYEIGYTESDYPYFYNKATGDSQWTHPNEDYYKDLVQAGKAQYAEYYSSSNNKANKSNNNNNSSSISSNSKYKTRIYSRSNSNSYSNNTYYDDDDNVNDNDDDDNDDDDESEDNNNKQYSNEEDDSSSNGNPLLRALSAGIKSTHEKSSYQSSSAAKIRGNKQQEQYSRYDYPETNENEIHNASYVDNDNDDGNGNEYDYEIVNIDYDVLTGCFASYLGIDINSESYLLTYVKAALQDLPDGWNIADSDGIPYYFTKTESSWYHPKEASIREMINREREQWRQGYSEELKMQAFGSFPGSRSRKVVIEDSGSDDNGDTPPRNNNNNNHNSSRKLSVNVARASSSRHTPSTYFSPNTESDVTPDRSPVVRNPSRSAGPRFATNLETATREVGFASAVTNDIEASGSSGDREGEDWVMVSSPRNNTATETGTKVAGATGETGGRSLANVAFGKKKDLLSSLSPTALSPTSSSFHSNASNLPQPKTPPPVSLIPGQQHRGSTFTVTPLNANIMPTSFKELILEELQSLDLSLEESELCFQFLHDMCYRKKEVLAELSEEEFKSVLDDPNSCKLKPGLKTNLKALHRKYRKEYINSPKFNSQNNKHFSKSQSSSNISSGTSSNSGSKNESPQEIDKIYLEVKANVAKAKAAMSVTSESVSSISNAVDSASASSKDIRQRIQRRVSNTNQSESGANVDITQSSSAAGGSFRKSSMVSRAGSLPADYDPNISELMKKREGDNQVLMEQMRELGIQPLQFIPLSEIRKEMDELMGKLNRGETFDDNRFDYLLRCMNINQEYKVEKEQEAIKWKNETKPIFNQWYIDMLAFMPSNIKELSITKLINYGYSKALATRLVSKECLWLIRMGKQHIAKMHIADLRGKYNYESQKLDIVELAAIFNALPDSFESDGNAGVKAKWKAGLETKLKAAYTQYVAKTLPKDLVRHPAYQNQTGNLTLETSTISTDSIIVSNPSNANASTSSSTSSSSAAGIKENSPPAASKMGLTNARPKAAGLSGANNMLAGLQNGLKALKKRDNNVDDSTSSAADSSVSKSQNPATAVPGGGRPKMDMFAEIKMGAGRLKKSQDQQGVGDSASTSSISSTSVSLTIATTTATTNSSSSSSSSSEAPMKAMKPKGGLFGGGGGGLSLIDELKNNRKFKTMEAVKSP